MLSVCHFHVGSVSHISSRDFVQRNLVRGICMLDVCLKVPRGRGLQKISGSTRSLVLRLPKAVSGASVQCKPALSFMVHTRADL